LHPTDRHFKSDKDNDPTPLPYLFDEEDQRNGALDIQIEVLILTAKMRDNGDSAFRLSLGNARDMYWTPAQLVAHHTSNGCDLNSGDLLGTGTISKVTPDGYGFLLEITKGGAERIHLPSGEERPFLEDGDEIILRATAVRPGFSAIGFGDCRGVIYPARTI
jgi:fumarylacetoacetase